MAEPYRYAGWLLRNDASARVRDKEGMIFVRKRENWRSDNCRVIYGAVTMGQTVSGGQATGITDGIRLSDWYYKYIREIKHMRSNT